MDWRKFSKSNESTAVQFLISTSSFNVDALVLRSSPSPPIFFCHSDILCDEKTFVSEEVFWENQIKYNIPTFLSLFWTAVDYVWFRFKAEVFQDPLWFALCASVLHRERFIEFETDSFGKPGWGFECEKQLGMVFLMPANSWGSCLFPVTGRSLTC